MATSWPDCGGGGGGGDDMRHEMLTQRALFYHRANTKPGMLSQHFMMHVVPPLVVGRR